MFTSDVAEPDLDDLPDGLPAELLAELSEDELWLGPPALDPPPALGDTAPSGLFGLELEFATANPALLSDADLVDAVIGFERMAAWAAARQYALLAEFHRRGGDGSIRPTTKAAPAREWAADEVALAVTVSPGSAIRRLAEADRLDGPLRATRDLLGAGRIDAARARLICDRTAVLDDTTAAAVQDRVLPDAPGQTWAQLGAALRRAILAVDADGAAARHRKAKAERRVELSAGEDGMATLWAKLSATDATAAFGWITRLARGMDTTSCDGGETVTDPRSIDTRRADVFAALLTGNLVITDPTSSAERAGQPAAPDSAGQFSTTSGSTGPGSTGPGSGESGGSGSDGSGSDGGGSDGGGSDGGGSDGGGSDGGGSDGGAEGGGPSRADPARKVYAKPVGADRPLVQITVPYSTMTGTDDEPCELVGYGPIPAHLARDLAAQAGAVWRRVVTDPLSGTVLDVGRTSYRPPAALADFVRARDMVCRNPRCRHSATASELDHVVEWQDGGVTAEHNLCALCVRHHDLKEAPGWQVVLHEDRRMEWVTPTGHRYWSRPHDHRPAASPPAPAPEPAPEPEEPDDDPPF